MVFESLTFIVLIFILCTIQSILGIGILVIGTPTLLIFNYQIVEIMFLLLPISIMTSIANLFIYNKNRLTFFSNNRNISKEFFTICLPFIFIGLVILKFGSNYISFDLLVSLVILLSLYIKNKNQKFLTNKKINKLFISLVGIIHGLTNSGGTLMSIIILNRNVGKEKKSINQIHFFYLLLASTQFVILFFLLEEINNMQVIGYLKLIVIVLIASKVGSLINKKISNYIVSKVIDILALITCFVLISKIFFSA